MASIHHEEQLRQALMQAAAKFISTVSNRTSLITVTDIKVGHGARNATIFVSVLPTKQASGNMANAEEEALNFLKRQRGEMREFIGHEVEMRQVPFLDIELDLGAKNAQNVDALLQDINKH